VAGQLVGCLSRLLSYLRQYTSTAEGNNTRFALVNSNIKIILCITLV
jgi:hypothetical protein